MPDTKQVALRMPASIQAQMDDILDAEGLTTSQLVVVAMDRLSHRFIDMKAVESLQDQIANEDTKVKVFNLPTMTQNQMETLQEPLGLTQTIVIILAITFLHDDLRTSAETGSLEGEITAEEAELAAGD